MYDTFFQILNDMANGTFLDLYKLIHTKKLMKWARFEMEMIFSPSFGLVWHSL